MFHGSNDALTHHSSACVIERVNVSFSAPQVETLIADALSTTVPHLTRIKYIIFYLDQLLRF